MKRILRGPVLVVDPSFIGMLKISGVVDDPRVAVGCYYRTVPYRPSTSHTCLLGWLAKETLSDNDLFCTIAKTTTDYPLYSILTLLLLYPFDSILGMSILLSPVRIY